MSEVAFGAFNGPKLIPLQNRLDDRGSFSKLFDASLSEFSTLKDLSVSISKNPLPGTLRGIHLQLDPFSESKLITCISGAIFDVIVDVRISSPTFKCWAKVKLDSIDLHQLYLPAGFAHGYQTLKAHTELIYVISGKYSVANTRRINYQDKELAIEWPLNVSHISVEDRNANTLNSLLDELR